jgi:hypothetical protein
MADENFSDNLMRAVAAEQPAADLVFTHDSEQSTMQYAKLLAQHPSGDQQRLGDCCQIGLVTDKLADPCLELRRTDYPDPEAEVAQLASQVILDVDCFRLQQLTAGQQHPSFLICLLLLCSGTPANARLIADA